MILFGKKNKQNEEKEQANGHVVPAAVKAAENAMSENIKLEKQIISEVVPHSIAHRLHIKPGDELLKIDGETVEDMFDYQYMTQNTHLTLTISGTNGKVRDITIDKDEDEDITEMEMEGRRSSNEYGEVIELSPTSLDLIHELSN